MKEIERIVQIYSQNDFNKESSALATVVNVVGSSYRRIGARMLVNAQGRWAGGISGGCLEGDALKKCQKAIVSNAPSLIRYDTSQKDDHQIGVGLGCEGIIDVLFKPLKNNLDLGIINVLNNVINQRTPQILMQVVDSSIQSQKVGKLYNSNSISEKEVFVTDWSINERVVDQMIRKVFNQQKSNLSAIETHSEKIQVLFEYVRPKIKLICVGDNYDIHSMVEIAKLLGWERHLVGNKYKYEKQVFNEVRSVSDFDSDILSNIDEYTAILLMTHDFNKDVSMLSRIHHLKSAYIGVLGPKKRFQKIISKTGLELESRTNIFAPVGLDIGATNPSEIALSICSEIISYFNNRDGHSLKFRTKPINTK